MAKCYKHDVEMQPAVIDYEYKGVVVKGVQALRCPECGEEVIGVERSTPRSRGVSRAS